MKRSQVFRNAAAPEGVVFLNYAKSKASAPAIDDIPTLVPKEAMAALTNGDTEPFFKVESIDFPAKGTGGVYDGSFFKSFLNVTKDRPIPGSKRGHEWTSRPNSDFYTVGGRIDSIDNGKTGTAHFKVYIPPTGDGTDNAAFKRDAAAGIVHFSLVTRPDYNVKTEKDEMGNPVQVRHFTATMGMERNDAMEYGAGAMPQVVNSQSMSIDFDAAKALIEAGHFDKETKIEGSPIQNGRVYRSALRQIVSRANGEDVSNVAELISMIDKSSNQRNGGKSVETKEEALAILKNAIANSQMTLADIAKGVGLEKLIRNAEDEANAATVAVLNEKLGDKPLERLEAVLAENAANTEFAVERAVTPIAGPKMVKNAASEDVENPAHKHAAEKCKGLSGDALANAVEALKDDIVMKALNAKRADGESELNRVEHGGAADKTTNSADDGIPTTRVSKKE